MTRPRIELWSPGPLANTLLIRPMAQCGNIKSFNIKGEQDETIEKHNEKYPFYLCFDFNSQI